MQYCKNVEHHEDPLHFSDKKSQTPTNQVSLTQEKKCWYCFYVSKYAAVIKEGDDDLKILIKTMRLWNKVILCTVSA